MLDRIYTELQLIDRGIPKGLFSIWRDYPNMAIVGGFCRDLLRGAIPRGDIDLVIPGYMNQIRLENRLSKAYGWAALESDKAWTWFSTEKTVQLLKKPETSLAGIIDNFDINVCQTWIVPYASFYMLKKTAAADNGIRQNKLVVNHNSPNQNWKRLVKHANMGFHLDQYDLLKVIERNWEEQSAGDEWVHSTPTQIFDRLRTMPGDSAGDE
jgi:hypothetical protein